MARNSNYDQIFSHGQQASVSLLLPDGTVCLEPAMIHSVVKEILWVLLSPALIPAAIDLDQGIPLEVRVGSSGQGFRCKAILSSYSTSGIMELHLTDAAIRDELRDYYRLDTFIPVTFQAHDAITTPPLPKVDLALDPVKRVEARIWWNKETEQRFRWDITDSDSFITNISGSGIKLKLEESVTPGDILHVTFQVPSPELKKISVWSRVAYLQPASSEDKLYAGMKFLNIHERDRDSIIKYVFSEELRQKKISRKPLDPTN